MDRNEMALFCFKLQDLCEIEKQKFKKSALLNSLITDPVQKAESRKCMERYARKVVLYATAASCLQELLNEKEEGSE